MYQQMVLIVLSLLAIGAMSEPPDATYDFVQLCVAHGYLVETHNVTTQDGYILTLYRVPGKASQSPLQSGKDVIFLQHGLLDLSDTWITNEPAPGFIAADAGFDVWFGNSRGSEHSLGHIKYNPFKDPAYWSFSWQQMGQYDIPASIDYVLQTTGKAKLSYVGHSQGTTQMFAHLAEQPDFMEKINIFIALAPVATIRHIDLSKIILETPLFSALELVGVYDFLPNPHTPSLFYYFCSTLGDICDWVIGLVADLQVSADNTARFPVILAHEPGGTSCRNMQHWQQMVGYTSYKLQKYNYGEKENQEIYDQPTPPVYDLEKIPGPIAFFTGNADKLADPTDVDFLRTLLTPAVVVYDQILPDFGHLTFLWGKNMTYFDTALSLAKQYSQLMI